MAIRQQGKAGFATLQQEGARLQIYVRLDAVGEQGFALYKLLDLGDHIGVTGYLFRTRTGELTVHVETLTFLAKAMLTLPEKYHGLADVELRYRQRYVDLFANLDAREVFVKRAKVLKALRTFFDSRGYLDRFFRFPLFKLAFRRQLGGALFIELLGQGLVGLQHLLLRVLFGEFLPGCGFFRHNSYR